MTSIDDDAFCTLSRWQRTLLAIVLVVFGVASGIEAGLAQETTPEAPPVHDPEPQVRGITQVDSPAARALVARHRPIVRVRYRDAMCAPDGEPYLPVPVEVVLANPAVRLRENTGRSDFRDPVLVEAPTVADLEVAEANTYLDFPGDPRNPGCTYERWYRASMLEHEPTVYARVVESDGAWVVIQYHFYYVFNDFNNNHEGDWEMIQVVYEAPDVITALVRAPVQVGYAQHSGGEAANWESNKLQREGYRPVVYVSQGSHAAHYRPDTYLGWGEQDSGFGCDTTLAPHREVEVAVELLPVPPVPPGDPMAWLDWRGRWGERQHWEYDGPVGPRRTKRWTDPVGWQERLRDSSISVPGATFLGPAPTDVFCATTTWGSEVLMRLVGAPWYFLSVLLVPLMIAGGLLWTAWSTIIAALRVYLRFLPVFAVLGLLIVPIGILSTGLYELAIQYSAIRTLVEVMEFTPASYYLAALPVSSIQQVIGLLAVTPPVLEIYRAIERGERITLRRMVRGVHVHFRPMVRALGRPITKVVIAQLTVVGLPYAIERAVRWNFVAPAVVLDDIPPEQAPARSASAVKGRWWRTAATLAVLTALGATPGPLLGVILIVTESPAIVNVNVLSSLIYAVTLPFAILGAAILYRQDLVQRLPASAEVPIGEYAPDARVSQGAT
jgi:hypothetical protein